MKTRFATPDEQKAVRQAKDARRSDGSRRISVSALWLKVKTNTNPLLEINSCDSMRAVRRLYRERLSESKTGTPHKLVRASQDREGTGSKG